MSRAAILASPRTIPELLKTASGQWAWAAFCKRSKSPPVIFTFTCIVRFPVGCIPPVSTPSNSHATLLIVSFVSHRPVWGYLTSSCDLQQDGTSRLKRDELPLNRGDTSGVNRDDDGATAHAPLPRMLHGMGSWGFELSSRRRIVLRGLSRRTDLLGKGNVHSS